MTPAELFHRAGVALFGDQYVAPMAVALGVEKNTVGKWRAGKSSIPDDVWRELRHALAGRTSDIFGVNTAITDLIRANEKRPPPG